MRTKHIISCILISVLALGIAASNTAVYAVTEENDLSVKQNKNIDFSLLKEGYYYYDIVDCPLDKQVEVRNSLNGIVTYVTPEEATGNITKYFRLCSAD